MDQNDLPGMMLDLVERLGFVELQLRAYRMDLMQDVVPHDGLRMAVVRLFELFCALEFRDTPAELVQFVARPQITPNLRAVRVFVHHPALEDVDNMQLTPLEIHTHAALFNTPELDIDNLAVVLQTIQNIVHATGANVDF